MNKTKKGDYIMHDNEITLIPLLAMLPYGKNIIITDIRQGDVFNGRICELDANNNERLNAMNYQKYRIRGLDVVNNTLIIKGYYDN